MMSSGSLRAAHRSRRNRAVQSNSPATREHRKRSGGGRDGNNSVGVASNSHSSAGGLSPRARGKYQSGSGHPQQPILSHAPSTWTGTVNTNTSLPQRNTLPAPRTVTPTSSNAMSWEDMDEGIYGTNNRIGRRGRKAQDDDFAPPANAPTIRHAVSMDSYDEDMPMDEMAATMKAVNNNQSSSLQPLGSSEPVRRGKGLGASRSFENLAAPSSNIVVKARSGKKRPPVAPSSAPDPAAVIQDP